ncbi:MAG: zf-HC2 domain-containing protein [Planctomycetota bacterium]
MNQKSKCRDLLEYLADYLDGELPANQLSVMEEHLAKCSPCVEYLESYRSTISMVRGCVPKPIEEEACDECPEALIKAILDARGETGESRPLH